MGQSYSLLRYPGGKSYLSSLLLDFLKINNALDCKFVEPFAGSAGAALRLLMTGQVSTVSLFDKDTVVSAFWKLLLDKPDLLKEFILTVPLTIDEWEIQKHNFIHSKSSITRAFAFFYLNRTNRSGVLTAGPIGGKSQVGAYRIDARFNRQRLCDRVNAICNYRDCIDFRKGDALFLTSTTSSNSAKWATGNTFLYLDPPYYTWGKELYHCSFMNKDHITLASNLRTLTGVPWVLSCDNHEDAITAYSAFKIGVIELPYFIHHSRKASELLVWPSWVKSPASLTNYQYTPINH